MEDEFILFEIFVRTRVKDLMQFSLVSQIWNNTVNMDSLWKHFCITEKKINFKGSSLTWKELYKVDIDKWKLCIHLCQNDLELELVSRTLVELRRDRARTCIEETCHFPFTTLWMCMSNHCGYYGCGRRDNAHSKEHHVNTSHPLHIKLNTLEIWCHSCNKWPGEDKQLDHPVEIDRTIEIRNKIVKYVTKWDQTLDPNEIARRKMERTLMETKEEAIKNKNVVYVVEDQWIEQWTRYAIGDSLPPTVPIDNSRFVLNGALNFSQLRDYTYVKPVQWEYFKTVCRTTYGAGPGIRLVFDPDTKKLKKYYIES